MKDEKRLRKIADKIINLEINIRKNRNAEECEEEIQRLSRNLSVEEMMFIDDYISEKMYH